MRTKALINAKKRGGLKSPIPLFSNLVDDNIEIVVDEGVEIDVDNNVDEGLEIDVDNNVDEVVEINVNNDVDDELIGMQLPNWSLHTPFKHIVTLFPYRIEFIAHINVATEPLKYPFVVEMTAYCDRTG